MARGDLTKHITKVSCQREIAAFVKLIVFESRPVSINLSATHAIAKHKHRVRVSVVSTTIAVLAHRATKLRHRQHDHVVHSLAQVLIERSDAGAELLQQISE